MRERERETVIALGLFGKLRGVDKVLSFFGERHEQALSLSHTHKKCKRISLGGFGLVDRLKRTGL